MHHYDPDGNPEESRKLVTNTVMNSLYELDFKRNLAIRQAMERLDVFSLGMLLEAASESFLIFPPRKTSVVVSIDDRSNAINRLLDLGVIQLNLEVVKAQIHRISNQNQSANLSKDLSNKLNEDFRYYLSPFGAALAEYCIEEMGISEDLIDKIDQQTKGWT